jgi:hypothetical protein
MGEAKRRRLVEAEAALLAALRAEGEAAKAALLEAFGACGRKLLTVEVLSPEAAMLRPDLAPRLAEAVVAAFAVARGESAGPMAECFACRAVWRPDLVPGAVLLTTITAAAVPKAVLLSFLCGACARLPPPGLRRLVLAGVRRDLLPDGEEVLVSPEVGAA